MRASGARTLSLRARNDDKKVLSLTEDESTPFYELSVSHKTHRASRTVPLQVPASVHDDKNRVLRVALELARGSTLSLQRVVRERASQPANGTQLTNGKDKGKVRGR